MFSFRRVGVPLLLTALIALVAPVTLAERGAAQTHRGKPDEAAAKGVTPTQIENAEARIAVATAIVNRLETEAKALGRSSGWRRASLDSLLGLSLSQLHRVEQEAHGVDSLASVIAEIADDPQVFGDPNQDLVYFPVTPCRYADTRTVGGPINGFRGYDVAQNGATYGGDAPCNPTALFGVSEGAIGNLAMNVTIVSPAIAPGFAAVKPTTTAPITSLVNWYEAGPVVQSANQGIVTLDQGAATEEFFVQTSATVHVVLDIFGAFLAPHATPLQVVTTEASVSVSTGNSWDIITPICPAGFTLAGGGHDSNPPATSIFIWQSSPHFGGTAWQCRGLNQSGGTISVTCTARCARVPGR